MSAMTGIGRMFGRAALFTALEVGVLSGPAMGQPRHEAVNPLGRASHVILPQRSGFAMSRAGQAIEIERVKARIRILQQTASTTLEIDLRNPSSRRAEAVLLLPVPDGAVVSAFMFEGASSEPTAEVLRREEARRLYDQIVAQIRDPALLEFAGYNLIRSSVFPIEPRGGQKIRLTYEHLLTGDGGRVDYVLPRSESLEQRMAWDIAVDMRSNEPISTMYSPSHVLDVSRVSARHVKVQLAEESKTQPGPFLLSFLHQSDDVSASLYAYPDPQMGGGYFLLMAGLPARIEDSPDRRKREVTIVIDRSGSMAGEKMDQVRAAALQVIEGLDYGEAFNIIDYATNVASFSAEPIVKTRRSLLQARAYLQSIRPGGGTNIHDALVEALRQKPEAGVLPIVLFLTDGLPTVGKTSEVRIREMAAEANAYDRRVFTFGVGVDVNAPLLDKIANESRAVATYVMPEEDVELKVTKVFKRLHGPVLSDLSLVTTNAAGAVTTRRVRELIPARLPDLFEDDQLILLGEYRGDAPLRFTLRGDFLGRERIFAFEFDLDSATTRNSFVSRLWASRRIAQLIDEIRQAGAEAEFASGGATMGDPRFRELSDEILRLSAEFGILTEYTAFLAREGTDLSDWEELGRRNIAALNSRAVQTRSGQAAINQSMNFNHQKQAAQRNYANSYIDERLSRVEISAVQQISDRSFFKQGNRWVDGRLVAQQQTTVQVRGGNGEKPGWEPCVLDQC